MTAIAEKLEKKTGRTLSFHQLLLVKTIYMVQQNSGISPRTMGLLSRVLGKKNVSPEKVSLIIKALSKNDVVRVAAVVKSIA